MFLSVKFSQYTVRFHAKHGGEYAIQDIKNTETGVYLGRRDAKYLELCASNDLRDVILDKIIYDITEQDWAQQAAEKAANDALVEKQMQEIPHFYTHPVWNAGGRTGGD